MTELPEGWAATSVSSFSTKIGSGATPRGGAEVYVEAGVPLIRSQNVHFDGFRDEGLVRLTPSQAAALEGVTVRRRDVLLNNTGASIGRVCVTPDRMDGARVNQHVAILRTVETAVIPEFLALFLCSPGLQRRIQSEEYGVTRQALTKAWICDLEVPLPPLPEQKRLVAKIEELLTHVNAARERLARIPTSLNRLRRAILAAACSGMLTRDWRNSTHEMSSHELVARLKEDHDGSLGARRRNAADPSDEAHDLDASTLPDSWTLAELAWLCEPDRPITYGILKPGPDLAEGIPYIRVADFPEDSIRPHGVRRTSRAIAEQYRRASLRRGDVLLSIRGTYGRVCRVPTQLDGANITQDTARITVSSLVNADYVAAFLRSPGTQDRLRRAARGVAVRGINIGDVRALQVPVPPLAEQAEIVRRLEAIFTLVSPIERRAEAALALSGSVRNAVLAKAFRGDLVPKEAELARAEGRDYESGEVLLARLQTGDAAGSAVAGGRRRAARRPGAGL